MDLYKDKNAPIESRVKDLMSKMTIEEKIGQMIQLPAKAGIVEENFIDKLEEWHIGSFLHCTGEGAAEIQRLAEKTRLGIPVIFGIDAIHGHCFEDKGTVFPTQLALSSSWNKDIVKEMAKVTATEVRACGLHWTFSPVLCVGRDTRWGRINETFGEDQWLIGELACAAIEGYQGENLSSENSILACAKHFAGYGESTGGRDSYESEISKRKMLSLFLPPFEKAVKKAKAATLMTGYQAIDGVPATANSWLLRDIPKEGWDFKGFIVTDWNNIAALINRQSVCGNMEDAAYEGIIAGNDMMMATPEFFDSAVKFAKEGKIPEEMINDSAERILRLKFELGLFDEKRHTSPELKDAIVGKKEHWDISLEASRQSLTLLKNDNTLPLDKPKSIFLTGPCADDVVAQLGDWSFGSMQAGATDESFHKDDTITVLDALKSAANDFNYQFDYLKGADIVDSNFDETDLAAEKAANSEYTIVCIGDIISQHGEGHDRAKLELSGKQQQLLEKVKATGTKLIVLFIASKPLAISWVKENADAIICCFNPGAKGGVAIKEALFGELNPAGKLTISFPYSAGQLPVHYDRYGGWHCDNGDNYERYIDHPEAPVFSFGEGMSYTTFEYSNLKMVNSAITEGENPKAQVTVKNSGSRKGIEVVQLYINDIVSSVTTPIMNLRAYKRVELEAGESKTVELEIEFDELSIVNQKLEKFVEKGDFEVYVGPSSKREECLKAIFTY